MFRSFSSISVLSIALLFISSLYVACGSADECQTSNDCIKAKGTGWICSIKSGKKVCEQKTTEGCKTDSDCDNGQICNTNTGKCEAKTGCTSNSDCAFGYQCNTGTGQCEPQTSGCKSNNDCAANETCNVATGKCEPKPAGCKSDSECAANETCNIATGKCEPKPAGCKSDSECAAGQTCNVATGKCVTKTPPGCTSDADCAANEFCDAATKQCKAKPVGCTSNADCAANEICDAATKQCKAKPVGCTSDADCAANEFCDAATKQCKTKPVGCTSDADCAANEFCDAATKQCKAKPVGCKSDADCAANETCNVAAGQCIPIPKPCNSDADCAANEFCDAATKQCKTKPTGCTSDADCAAGQTCEMGTGQCRTVVTGCGADKDCSAGQRCNISTGQCVTSSGTGEAGQPCDQANPCQTGYVCITISDIGKSLCFQDCTNSQSICQSNTDGRTSCVAFARTSDGDTVSVCLGEGQKGSKCGFEGLGQSICKRSQNPPLYCNNKGNCDETVVQKKAGDACNTETDNTDPLKICDSSLGLVCGAQGTCVVADQADEGQQCDPDGKTLGKQVLCKTGMICVGFTFGSITANHCHKECDTSKSNCASGTSCLALSGGGTRGVCLTTNCISDADCPLTNYQCAQTTGGQKICFPPYPTGPKDFGQICGTPVNTKGCKKDLFCIKGNSSDPEGFCTSECTQTNTCPSYTNAQGKSITAQCTAINTQGDKACLFPCGQPGQICPDGLACKPITGGDQICLAP